MVMFSDNTIYHFLTFSDGLNPNTDFALSLRCYFMFNTKVTFKKNMILLKTYHCTKFQDFILNPANVALTLEIHTLTMLFLLW
jgi:hypothetical protein